MSASNAYHARNHCLARNGNTWHANAVSQIACNVNGHRRNVNVNVNAVWPSQWQSREHIYEAFENIYPVLTEFKKDSRSAKPPTFSGSSGLGLGLGGAPASQQQSQQQIAAPGPQQSR